MKSLFSRISKYYIKIFVFFIIMSLSIIIISTYLLYKASSDNIKENLINSSIDLLSKSSYYLDFVFNLTMSFSVDIYMDSTIKEFLNTEVNDPILENRIETNLSRKKSIYPFIYSVAVYNAKTGKIIDSNNTPQYLNEHPDKNFIAILMSEFENDYVVMPRKIIPGRGKQPINVLTLILVEKNLPENSIRNAIIVNLYEGSFNQIVTSHNTSKNNEIFIIDNNKVIISHEHVDKFMQDYSRFDYIQKILSDKTEKGSFNQQLNGQNYIISFVKNDKMNWTIINLLSENHITDETREILDQIIIICLVIFVLSIVLAILFSKKIYKPVNRLIRFVAPESDIELYNINEMEYISNKYNDTSEKAKIYYEQNKMNINLLREDFFRNLFMNDFEEDNISELISKYEMHLELKSMRVILLKISNYKDLPDNQKSRLRIHLSSILKETVLQCDYLFIPMFKGEFSIIFYDKNENAVLRTENLELLQQLQNKIIKLLGCCVAIGIGDCADSITLLRASYRSALEMLKYRIIYGPSSILYPDLVNKNIQSNFVYPDGIEKAVANSIRLNKIDDFQNEMDKLILLCKSWSYAHIYYVISQFVMVSIKTINSVCQDSQMQVMTSYHELNDLFENIGYLEDVKEWFNQLYVNRQQIVNDIDNSKAVRKQELFNDIIKYIEENISNPDINVETVASFFNMLPNNLSKQFKKAYNMNLSEYISNVRINEAKALLKETELSIDDIAVNSGLPNINYFYHVFKKNVGLTPANYRLRSRVKHE